MDVDVTALTDRNAVFGPVVGVVTVHVMHRQCLMTFVSVLRRAPTDHTPVSVLVEHCGTKFSRRHRKIDGVTPLFCTLCSAVGWGAPTGLYLPMEVRELGVSDSRQI